MQLYENQISKLKDNEDDALQFLKFAATNFKYNFEDQIQLFTHNPNAQMIASYDQWLKLKRPVQGGEKAMALLNHKTGHFTNYFDISQTEGVDIRVFDWDINERDQDNLGEYWSRTNPIYELTGDFADQLELFMYEKAEALGLIPSSEIEKHQIFAGAKFIINERMGLPIDSQLEKDIRSSLSSSGSKEQMSDFIKASQNITKATLLDIEKTLKKEYKKEMISHEKRTNRIDSKSELSGRTIRAAVPRRRDFTQSEIRSGSIEESTTGTDWEIHSNETGRDGASDGRSVTIRGETILPRQSVGEQSAEQARKFNGSTDGNDTRTSGHGGENPILHPDQESSNESSPSGIYSLEKSENNSDYSEVEMPSEFFYAENPRDSPYLKFGINLTPFDYEALQKLKDEVHDDEDIYIKFRALSEEKFRADFVLHFDYYIDQYFEHNEDLFNRVIGDLTFEDYFIDEVVDEIRQNMADKTVEFELKTEGEKPPVLEDEKPLVSTPTRTTKKKQTKPAVKVETREQLSLFPSFEDEPKLEKDDVVEVSKENKESEFKIEDLDIDALLEKQLLRGSGIENGKYRIYHLFQNESNAKNRANFLKKEHGTGGWTTDDYYVNKSPKGYSIKHMRHDDSEGRWLTLVNLTWAKIEQRIGQLIDDGKYLNEQEFSRYQALYSDEAIEVEAEPEEIGALFSSVSIKPEAVEQEVLPEKVEKQEPSTITPQISNWSFPDGEFYDTGTRQKLLNNHNAIKLVKALENEGRTATKEEQEVLAKYVGWGGLSKAFDEKAWPDEYRNFKKLLTDDEWRAARNSIDTAYYTDPRMAKAIYEAVEMMGLKPENVLDPATGTGNFLSVLPNDINLYGVEIEPLTASIAKHLYPNAKIASSGFEEMDFPTDSFDLAIGNIPFGEFKIRDKRYDKDYVIHDYFMAKSMDVVRPGGIVAFVTSRYTLDKRDSEMRKYLAERADLVGAIRLPNTAFKDIAGTSVTSDIIFLQKREVLRDLSTDMPSWVYVAPFGDKGAVINSYFEQNPNYVLGEIELSGQFGGSTIDVKPYPDHDIYGNIQNIAGELASLDNPNLHIESLMGDVEESDDGQEIEGEIDTPLSNEPEIVNDLDRYFESESSVTELPAGVRNNTYFVLNDQLYFNRLGIAEEVFTNKTNEARLKAMCEVRKHLIDVIDIQIQADYSKEDYDKSLVALNTSYDAFVKNYGHFRDSRNRDAFRADDQTPLLLSIEKVEEGKPISKSTIFFEPTIRPNVPVANVDNAHDALLVSLARKLTVDMAYMEEISHFSKDQLIADLVEQGLIYQDPAKFESVEDVDAYNGWVYRDEYLSDDIIEKLTQAKLFAETNPEQFTRNVQALELTLPTPVQAGEIAFQLASTWIPKEHYEAFMHETLNTPDDRINFFKLEYCSYTNYWHISNKYWGRTSEATSSFGTNRMNGYEILEKTLNMKQINVYDRKKSVQILNITETMLAREKQDKLKREFQNWLFKDPTRTNELVELYNEKFNRFVPRDFDGSHLEFPHLNSDWVMRPHQKNFIARVLYTQTGLAAHEVGAGKTSELIAAGMYLKQVGVINKPVHVVPTHLTESYASEFMMMYPTANVLMTSKRDFEKKNRHEFISKIATNDYDAVIIGQTQFEKIALSMERQAKFIGEQITEVVEAIERASEDDGKSWTVKQMVRFEKNLQAKLEKLMASGNKDDILDYEQLGIDFLFVDEAHHYKVRPDRAICEAV